MTLFDRPFKPFGFQQSKRCYVLYMLLMLRRMPGNTRGFRSFCRWSQSSRALDRSEAVMLFRLPHFDWQLEKKEQTCTRFDLQPFLAFQPAKAFFLRSLRFCQRSVNLLEIILVTLFERTDL